MQGRKLKFNLAERVVGRESARASFRRRTGTVIERGPGKAEYGVKFDDGPIEYVESSWMERLANSRQSSGVGPVDSTLVQNPHNSGQGLQEGSRSLPIQGTGCSDPVLGQN